MTGVDAPVVQLLEPLEATAVAALAGTCEVLGASADIAAPDESRIDALIVRGAVKVGPEMMDRLPKLRVIARAGVGVDNIDLDAAAVRNVGVLHVPHALTQTVAEHALALALMVRRDAVRVARATRMGDLTARQSYAGDSLGGARVAVVGLGSIGQRAADLFRAVGANVVTWSRSGRGDVETLSEALDGAEVLSLHCALNDDTRGLIGAVELAQLAPGAAVVNTARPAVVARGPLLDALASGHVGGYAVDGHEEVGPAQEDPLLQHECVIVTPHTAALTRSAFRDLCLATVTGVMDVLASGEPSGAARFVGAK